MAQPRDLYEFLSDAELQHYFSGFKNDLKVTSVAQLKYVEDEDLVDMGMTKPEMRRLKKYFRKECPQGTFGKLKKILVPGQHGVGERSPPVAPVSPQPTPGRHVIPEDAITVLKMLGTGEFGTVQQGVWSMEDGKRVQVAIKCLAKTKMESGMSDFLKEATIMYTLDHDYIVRLYGVVLGLQSLMLVTELAPLRSLLECLKDPALRASFTLHHLVHFTLQIAEGMAYLESKRFIHRDLAARNILVFAKDKVKISDFGLSRALGVGKDYYQTNFNVNLKLPIAWCAPECINYLKFTSASDVWAYGVTVWEIFSYGFQPWAGFAGQQILDAIDEPNNQRLERPELCPSAHYDLMLKCWEHLPEKRPKFSELAAQLSMLKPEKVQAIEDFTGTLSREFLYYKAMDIITVLDRKCENPPVSGMWRGVMGGGKLGYFDPTHVAPYVDLRTSPAHRKTKISRKESARKSSRMSKSKLHAGLIGKPQSDLRHTGHIGYDGAMFGDVSFIGDNYDKLPVKVVTPTRMYSGRANGGSVSSLSFFDDVDDTSSYLGQSELSLNSTRADSMLTMSMGSVMTMSMDDTLTDVSSMISELDNLSRSKSEEQALDKYEEIGDQFDNFKMPEMDLGLGSDLDLGPSFMDEVMKALGSTKESPAKNSLPQDDRSPLIERDAPFGPGKTSFDNVAMVTENDSHVVTDTDSDRTNKGSNIGSLSSFTSQEASDGREMDAPLRDDKKKKSKLKLDGSKKEKFIPVRDVKAKDRMRTLSASDEKRIDDAMEQANEFAQIRISDHMTGSPSEGEQNGRDSPKPRSGFGLRKKSPRQEKKSFTDEMNSQTSSAEILTPEAQEAYNLLVVKGATPDKAAAKRTKRLSKESTERLSFMSRTGRIHQNIREPQGIPCPVISPRILQENGEGDVDANPLRRLRDSSHSFMPKPKTLTKPKSPGSAGTKSPGPGGHSTEQTNGWGKKPPEGARPELNANLSFFAKLKEQEERHERAGNAPGKTPGKAPGNRGNATDGESFVSVSNDVSQCSPHDNGDVSTNHIPLPPRAPLKSTVTTSLNQKPRQRKYPLDMSTYSRNSDDPRLSGHYSNDPRLSGHYSNPGMSEHSSDQDVLSSDGGSDALGLSWGRVSSTQDGSDQLNVTQESDDSVFTDGEHATHRPNTLSSLNQRKLRSVSPLTGRQHRRHHDNGEVNGSQMSLSVKGVKVTASDLGYFDTADLFWAKQIDFNELAPGGMDSNPGDLDLVPGGMDDRQPSPIPGRYKTSDNVSYEDLMEFALDGDSPNPREAEETVCDEVRLMRRVLSKDVTTEDCMYALEETRWEVHSSIKLIQLKQLLSAKLADKDQCKNALMANHWNVQDAANQLLAHPQSHDSPDLVHV